MPVRDRARKPGVQGWLMELSGAVHGADTGVFPSRAAIASQWVEPGRRSWPELAVGLRRSQSFLGSGSVAADRYVITAREEDVHAEGVRGSTGSPICRLMPARNAPLKVRSILTN